MILYIDLMNTSFIIINYYNNSFYRFIILDSNFLLYIDKILETNKGRSCV